MLSRLFTNTRTLTMANAGWGVWPGDSPTVAGQTVNQSTALQLLAVSGCVRLITDSISTLPVDTYTRFGGITREVPVPRWITQPTVDLDFTSWSSQILTSLLLHGNAYFVVTRNSGGGIVEMIPQDPANVRVVRYVGQRPQFIVGGQPYTGEMVHLKGMMLPGSDVGLSPLEYARQSIGLGLAAMSTGADQFANGLNMPGVLKYPVKVAPEQQIEIAQSWRRARTKTGRGLPGLIDQGGDWMPTGVTNEQAQFLETRQWTAAEIAGQVFLIDPRELGIPVTGSTLNYTNAENRKSDLLGKALLPWITRVESALTNLLPFPRFMKFNVDGFLRADSAARWTIYSQAMNINSQAAQLGQPPVLTTEEMRDFEDLQIQEGA